MGNCQKINYANMSDFSKTPIQYTHIPCVGTLMQIERFPSLFSVWTRNKAGSHLIAMVEQPLYPENKREHLHSNGIFGYV